MCVCVRACVSVCVCAPACVCVIFWSLIYIIYVFMGTKLTYKFGPRHEKTCLRVIANSKSTDQHAHPRSLISTLAIRLMETSISRLATGEMSIFC